MAGYPPPYPPPPPPGPPYGPPQDWRYQRRFLKDQARAQREAMRAQRDAFRAQARGYRRGSIVGPVLVIAVGVTFLLAQTGRIASQHLWDWYGRWWPILLIGVGGIVLLEWIVDTAFHRDAPYGRRSIGGGIIFLLILFAVAGLSYNGIRDGGRHFLLNNFNINQEDLDQFIGDKHESDQSLDHALPAGSAIEVDNPRGDITLSGTSDDNQIHVILHKEVYSRSDSDAATKAQQLSPAITSTDGSLQLRLPLIDGARGNLIVTVPPTAVSTIMANHGDVHVSGLKAPVTITANHGDVEISAINGPITTHINNSSSSFSVHSTTGPVTLAGRGGDVTINDIDGPVSIDGDFFGSTHLEHIRANVRFHSTRTDFKMARLDGEMNLDKDDLSADQALGPVILTTRSHNITLDRIAGDVSVVNKNGSVDLTSAPPLGNVTVENRNGSVNLTLPEQAGFNVHADTSSGNLENDFDLPTVENDEHSTIQGTVGKGTATIHLSTTDGDIAIKKSSVAPLPPLPPLSPVLTLAPPSVPGQVRESLAEAQRQLDEARRQGKLAEEEAKRQLEEAKRESRRQAEDAKRQAKQATNDDND